MKVVVSGAAGFIGSRVADFLLSDKSPLAVNELILVDIVEPSTRSDPRVRNLALDLTSPDAAHQLIDSTCDVFFHLAAIASGNCEADFDFCFTVNFKATRNLLETARKKAPTLKFVFSSTIGVFANPPPLLNDLTAVQPTLTYGTTKAMSELMINEYSRKGFVDGRVVRLPTVCGRPSYSNGAITAFASSIIWKPLNGKKTICPVGKEIELWLTSPQVVVINIVHTATIPAPLLGMWRVINLPGITVSVDDMLQTLKNVAGENVVKLVNFKYNKTISDILATGPRQFDITRALCLGFTVDSNFTDAVKALI